MERASEEWVDSQQGQQEEAGKGCTLRPETSRTWLGLALHPYPGIDSLGRRSSVPWGPPKQPLPLSRSPKIPKNFLDSQAPLLCLHSSYLPGRTPRHREEIACLSSLSKGAGPSFQPSCLGPEPMLSCKPGQNEVGQCHPDSFIV